MNIRTIRWVIALGIIAIVAIILSQAFWIRKGLLINQSNFENAITLTLEQVAERIEVENHGKKLTEHPVVRISPHAYVVNISEQIDLNKLDYYMRNEFANPFHKVDFVYQVFDRAHNDLVFEETVSAGAATEAPDKLPTNLPVLNTSTYYFKINFPERPIVNSVMIFVWATSIVALTVVLIFFGYSLDVIVRQKRLSEFQTNFINNLAHEFKTPISTIGISADVLMEPDIAQDPDRLRGYAKIISKENKRLAGQVSKILELAKLEEDELSLHLESFHLNELVQGVADSFRLRVQEAGGTLRVELKVKNDTILADKVHLENVLNTLLDNALKYNSKIPDIDILTANDDNGIFISVGDNGIGISKEYHKKIFEKFFRIPTGNVHNVKGYGLGLSYVRMIARAHKWRLRMDSELHKGSIFTIIIPPKTM
ncbi:MAG: HAMP domain-containing sensor histidine kinase [Chitinophagales bacterium]